MKRLTFVLKYLNYYFTAKTRYKIHSPFVYDLLINAIYYYHFENEFNIIEGIRNDLMAREDTISYYDFGAKGDSSEVKKKINEIIKDSSKNPKYSRLLYKIVRYFEPRTLIELGTSFGISAMYQALAADKGKLLTIEGSKEIAEIAKQNFIKLGIVNAELVVDTFDNALPKILNNIDKLDYVFFDGNHRKEPTINYFEQCLTKVHSDSVFVFDDIHWSKEMEEAWKYIQNHKKVTITLDLFFLGIVFFVKGNVKQNHKIKF